MNKYRTTTKLAVVAVTLLLVTFAGCNLGGGSSGGGSDAGSGSNVVMTGTMTKGSVILNGVRYDDTAAGITADETSITAAELGNGMTVKLKGTVDSDGVNGTAELVEVENELRGSVASIDLANDSFIVLGSTVYVDGTTVFEDVADLASLAVNDPVEIHGMRNSSGIRATRVDLLSSAPEEDEIRGIVTSKSGTSSGSFQISGSSSTFSYDSSTVIDGGTSFANGDLVEVHLSGLNATLIELEDAEDREFESSDEFELEGYISNYDGVYAAPETFTVGTQRVETSETTEFEGGSPADLANDVRIEVEGLLSGGTLFATEIEFEETIKLVGDPTAGSAALFGVDVEVTGMTEFDGDIAAEADIDSADLLQVRGFLAPNGSTVIATEIEQNDGEGLVEAGEEKIQGIATSVNGTTSLVIAGVTIDATSVSDSSFEINYAPATKAEFFSALVVNRTVVEAKGDYEATSANTFDAVELSVE